MKIVGCDLHTRYQQIAMLDEETGELVERRLEHGNGEAKEFLCLSIGTGGGWRTLDFPPMRVGYHKTLPSETAPAAEVCRVFPSRRTQWKNEERDPTPAGPICQVSARSVPPTPSPSGSLFSIPGLLVTPSV
jgi:hypothetical protein